MARVRKRELDQLIEGISKEYPDLEKYIKVRDAQNFYQIIEKALVASSKLKRNERKQFAASLAEVAAGIILTYDFPEQPTNPYDEFFSIITNSTLCLREDQRIPFLKGIKELMITDMKFKNYGATYQFVPTFARELLAHLGNSPEITKAMQYTHGKVSQLEAKATLGYTPTDKVLFFEECFRQTQILTANALKEASLTDDIAETAQMLIKNYGVIKVGSLSPKSPSVTIWTKSNGQEQKHQIRYPRGIPENISSMLYEVKRELVNGSSAGFSSKSIAI